MNSIIDISTVTDDAQNLLGIATCASNKASEQRAIAYDEIRFITDISRITPEFCNKIFAETTKQYEVALKLFIKYFKNNGEDISDNDAWQSWIPDRKNLHRKISNALDALGNYNSIYNNCTDPKDFPRIYGNYFESIEAAILTIQQLILDIHKEKHDLNKLH